MSTNVHIKHPPAIRLTNAHRSLLDEILAIKMDIAERQAQITGIPARDDLDIQNSTGLVRSALQDALWALQAQRDALQDRLAQLPGPENTPGGKHEQDLG